MDLLQDKRHWDKGFTSLRRWKEYWKRLKRGKQLTEHNISADEAMTAIGACLVEAGCVPLEILGYDESKEWFEVRATNGNKQVFDVKIRDHAIVACVVTMRALVFQPVDKPARRPSEIYKSTTHPVYRYVRK